MPRIIFRSLMLIPIVVCSHTALLLGQATSQQAPGARAPRPTSRAADVSYYFPPASFAAAENPHDERMLSIFAFVLRAMGETPLSAAPTDGDFMTYRLTWVLFPSSTMIVARLDIKRDGTGSLTTEVGTGPGHHETTDSVSAAEVDKFLELTGQPDFWSGTAAENPPPRGIALDGSDWLLEGVGNNGHHAIFRTNWNGAPGPYADAAHFLTKDFARLGTSTITTVNSTPKSSAP
jgi:hypothetical protein